MQTRFLTSGVMDDAKQVWLAYALNQQAFRLELRVVEKKLLDAAQTEALHEWPETGTFDFPAETVVIMPDLNSDTILPDNIKSEKTGEIRHKQNEWAIELVTNKLWEAYLIEMDQLKKRAAELMNYDKSLFDEAKSFWERVLEHKKERNITQEKLDKIKEDVNAIFEKLKTFRKTESAEFEKRSNEVRQEVQTRLEALKAKVTEKANFKSLHDEIKAIQQEFRQIRLLKSDEGAVRKAFDDAFHFISESRQKYFSGRNEARIAGLNDVIQKMEKGLERDRKDLEYFTRKAEHPKIHSLEMQVLKLRIRQINDIIASKEEKLKDIYKTRESLLKGARQENSSKESDKAVVAAPEEPLHPEAAVSSDSKEVKPE
ncbi:MAG: hypothetical protein U0T84_09750 [Chitinophagales bacterium]